MPELGDGLDRETEVAMVLHGEGIIQDLALRLSTDAALVVTDPAYAPLARAVEGFLRSGYRPKEVQAELMLTDDEFARFRSRVPDDFWERNESSALRHLARKRAALLTSPTADDLTIVQALDGDWNPKMGVKHAGEVEWKVTVAPFMLPPSAKAAVDAELTEKSDV